MKEPSSHKYGGLHCQLDRIGCEMGSREGRRVETFMLDDGFSRDEE